MNEEMNVEVVDVVETMDNNPIEVETFDGSKVDPKTVVIIAGLAVLTGGVSLAIANRRKIKNWVNARRIKKLEKDGYTVGYTELPLGNYDSEEVVVKNEETK